MERTLAFMHRGDRGPARFFCPAPEHPIPAGATPWDVTMAPACFTGTITCDTCDADLAVFQNGRLDLVRDARIVGERTTGRRLAELEAQVKHQDATITRLITLMDQVATKLDQAGDVLMPVDARLAALEHTASTHAKWITDLEVHPFEQRLLAAENALAALMEDPDPATTPSGAIY